MSSNSKSTPSDNTSTTKPPPPKPTLLEEDDEFEDFPVEDWTAAESELPPTSGNGTNSSSNPTHLWEESWDDDDENEDFAKQLREELKKVEGGK